MNACNLAYHSMKDDMVDIIVNIHHKWCQPNYSKDLAKRVEQAGIFSKVCYRKDDPMTVHQYLRDWTQGRTPRTSFWEAVKSNVADTISNGLSQKDEFHRLATNIVGFENLDIDTYDRFLAQRNDNFVNAFYHHTKEKYSAKWYVLDEGTGAYTRMNIAGEGTMADGYYLYEPALFYKPEIQTKYEFLRIPPLNPADKAFIQKMNEIFAYQPSNTIDFHDAVILFTSPSDPLPKYLEHPNIAKKIIFHNAYKKHKKKAEEFETREKIFRRLISHFHDRTVWVKFHPSVNYDVIHQYDAYSNVKVIPAMHCPWELFACNHVVEGAIFISEGSSAGYLFDYVTGRTHENYSIQLMLLPQFLSIFKQELMPIANNWEREDSTHRKLPKSEEEFWKLIDALG